jgi:predicted transcriptional regulator
MYYSVIYKSMTPIRSTDKEIVTFRIPLQKRTELDQVAQESQRDRSFILNEAVDAYLEAKRWQIVHVQEGLRDADAKRFSSDTEIRNAYTGI